MKSKENSYPSSYNLKKKSPYQEPENTFSEELFETAVTIMRIQGEEILKNSPFGHTH